MIECETVTRKWGNSIGLTLPKETVEEAHIKEDEKIKVLILKQSRALKETFGMAKSWKKPAQKIKDELKRELHYA